MASTLLGLKLNTPEEVGTTASDMLDYGCLEGSDNVDEDDRDCIADG